MSFESGPPLWIVSLYKQLHAQLRIIPAEQPRWDQFAQVMRDNARDMDQALMQRAQQVFRANAERHEAQSRHDATATAK